MKRKYLYLVVILITLRHQTVNARLLDKGDLSHVRPAHKRRLIKHRQAQSSSFKFQKPSQLKSKPEKIAQEDQLPITVIIYAQQPNVDFNTKSVDSVLQQNYDHYQVLYIDNGADTDRQQQLREYLKDNDKANKVTIKTHKKRQGKLQALYHAIHARPDEEIIVLLNDNDWFADEWTLTVICKAYLDNDIWFTYGSCAPDPQSITIGIRTASVPEKIQKKRYFRKIFPYMPPRTFYAWLFKQINKEELIDPITKDFFTHAPEAHIVWPLIEMAADHFAYLKPATYIINCNDPLTKLEEDYYLRMACNAQMGKNLPVYQPLEQPAIT